MPYNATAGEPLPNRSHSGSSESVAGSGHLQPLVRCPAILVRTCLPLSRFSVSLNPMLDWSSCPAVERVPGKVSGAWVFRGTRVPVKALFENLEDGACIDDFLHWFPGVTRQQVEAVLEHTQQSLQTEAG